MQVLIGTGPVVRDACVPWVLRALQRRGAQAWVFDSGRFPVQTPFATGGRGAFLCTEQGEVALDALDAVWLRYLDCGASVAEHIHPNFREAALAQSGLALYGMLSALRPRRYVDHPRRLQAAPEHIEQLLLAQSVGLRVPDTVVTSSDVAVRDLMERHPQGIVSKLMHSSALRLRDAQGQEHHVPTQRVDPTQSLDGLNLCPMIFQELIPKALDVRVVAVGRRLFSAAVDPQGSPLGAVDWRQDPTLNRRFVPWTPDSSTELALQRFMDAVGLEYATLDLVQTPAGETVFLEMNTVSFYDFIELATGLPISEALAGLLLGDSPSRLEPAP